MLELFLFAMDKKLKEIWHCKDLSSAEKAAQGLALGEAIAEMGVRCLNGWRCWRGIRRANGEERKLKEG